MPKSKPQRTLTKSRFMRLLRKSAQPVLEWKHDQAKTKTSVVHPFGDCNGKCKNRDKTEDAEG